MKPYYLIFERTKEDPRWTLFGASPLRAHSNLRAIGLAKEKACQTVVKRVDLPDDEFLQGCEMLDELKDKP